ncbi:hypothetical protein U9M48_010852 [Paspalum notatum var. saurae]|uniref:DUF1618 domain-containing protein n=1 Tax=Paspalum notatum var. saurae TaxID=547442 RepID=A0AAQ3SUC4_PASNO
MDAPRSFLALQCFIPVHGLEVTPGKERATITPPGEEWACVKCARKKAYGCGKRGQRLVDGITLYVCRADHPEDLAAYVSIGLSDDAVRIMEGELGVRRGLMESHGSLQISHQQFLVMILEFDPHAHPKRLYYIIYDSTDASLYMIPFIPEDLVSTRTLQAIPERSADGVGLKQLVLTAREPYLQRVDCDRLCVFTPAAQKDRPESVRWQAMVHTFMHPWQRFSADTMFSFQGKFFWADLSRGVAYSDLGTGCSGPVVDTVFVRLPDEYQLSGPPYQFDRPKMSRTMGCVGDSIKFVCIDRCHETIKALTLDLDHQVWKEDEGFSCSWNDLWKQLISFMNVEMPLNLQPQYPILFPDGALFLFLPSTAEWACLMDGNHHVCCFDMITKRPLFFGLVSNYHAINPVIVPSDFFAMCQSSSAPAGEAAMDKQAFLPMCF